MDIRVPLSRCEYRRQAKRLERGYSERTVL
nr:MAG TPA: hypothetical protein [Caudoviricetes sp.]